MADKYNFFETTIAYENVLYYKLEKPSIPEHRDVILQNNDILRIVHYTHQFPDGAESICYNIQDYIALEKAFRRRKLSWEELILLIYGVIHTVSNAKKCGLLEDSFVLDPRYVYLSSDSIQPYLLYLPTMVESSLRDEFLALLNFIDGATDVNVPDAMKLITVLKATAQDDFFMHSIINVIVKAANTRVVEAPAKSAREGLAEKPADAEAALPKVRAPSARVPSSSPKAAASVQAAASAQQDDQKKGFFSRFFGGYQQDSSDELIPSIDDRTMIDFTAHGGVEREPVLYLLEGDFRTMQIPVRGKSFVLGRNRSEVDFCFDGENDKGISRVHAAIINDGSGYIVVDRGSSGGTFVNHVRLSPGASSPIKNGDVIGLFNKKLLFELSPCLSLLENELKVLTIPITKHEFVLGRKQAEVDYCFTGEKMRGVSRIHAAVIFDGKDYYIRDKGSSGGTFVNDRRLDRGESTTLRSGDVIALNNIQLLFEAD